MARKRHHLHPYAGVRLNRRGLRPYAGVGCWTLCLFVLALSVLFVVIGCE